MLAMLTHDLRDAARNLRRNRGFAASAIAILAIGIAASTGLFAVVDAVVLHPLPYAGADRLARVQLLPPSGPVRPASVTADEFRALRQASTLDGAYIRESFTKTLGGSSFPESVWTEYYTGNALSLLGVQPVIGRVFTEADAPIGPRPAARRGADVPVLATSLRRPAQRHRPDPAAQWRAVHGDRCRPGGVFAGSRPMSSCRCR